MYLPSFLMPGREYDTAQKLYAIPALILVSTVLIFCLLVAAQFH